MAENSPTESAAPEKASKVQRYIRWVLLAGVIVAIVLLGREAAVYVDEFREWVAAQGAWGPVLYMLGYAVAAVAFVPGSALTIGAGAVFGLVEGTIYTLLGATLGAALAFLVGRYFAREKVQKKIAGDERFAAVDKAIGRQGFKITALLRLSPIFPYNLLNYALGLTKVGFWPYTIASIAMLPGTILYVYIGTIGGQAAEAAGEGAASAGKWALLGLGLLATVAAVWAVTRKARQILREETGLGETSEEASP